MLSIVIPAQELWDEYKEEFIVTKEVKIQLEHSLVSISKWEAKWHKPFLASKDITGEQMLDYIRCMTITQNVSDDTYHFLSDDNVKAIKDYMDDPMTATWFNDKQKRRPNGEVVTSELIYYWMIALNIPVEFQKWHINRLLTLIKVCELKQEAPKKMSQAEIAKQHRELNAARRKATNSRG